MDARNAFSRLFAFFTRSDLHPRLKGLLEQTRGMSIANLPSKSAASSSAVHTDTYGQIDAMLSLKPCADFHHDPMMALRRISSCGSSSASDVHRGVRPTAEEVAMNKDSLR